VGGGGGRVEGREGCCCHLRGLLSDLGSREDENLKVFGGICRGRGIFRKSSCRLKGQIFF
jgi:hypothetical protein